MPPPKGERKLDADLLGASASKMKTKKSPPCGGPISECFHDACYDEHGDHEHDNLEPSRFPISSHCISPWLRERLAPLPLVLSQFDFVFEQEQSCDCFCAFFLDCDLHSHWLAIATLRDHDGQNFIAHCMHSIRERGGRGLRLSRLVLVKPFECHGFGLCLRLGGFILFRRKEGHIWHRCAVVSKPNQCHWNSGFEQFFDCFRLIAANQVIAASRFFRDFDHLVGFGIRNKSLNQSFHGFCVPDKISGNRQTVCSIESKIIVCLCYCDLQETGVTVLRESHAALKR